MWLPNTHLLIKLLEYAITKYFNTEYLIISSVTKYLITDSTIIQALCTIIPACTIIQSFCAVIQDCTISYPLYTFIVILELHHITRIYYVTGIHDKSKSM